MYKLGLVHDDWKPIVSKYLADIEENNLDQEYSYISDMFFSYLKMPLKDIRVVLIRDLPILPGLERAKFPNPSSEVVYEFNLFMQSMIENDAKYISSSQYELTTLKEKGVLMMDSYVFDSKYRKLEVIFYKILLEIIRKISEKGDVVWISTCISLRRLCLPSSIVDVQMYIEDDNIELMPIVHKGNYLIHTRFRFSNMDTTNYFKITNQVLKLINKLPIDW